MTDTTRVNVIFKNETYEQLRTLAFEQRTTIPEIIRQATEVHIKNLKGDNTMQAKYTRLLEIAEETGEVPVSSIGNLTETITDLAKLGYTAYLDPSTDFLIVEKDA
jgi:hypothetical protein